jgi:hypothetical protein
MGGQASPVNVARPSLRTGRAKLKRSSSVVFEVFGFFFFGFAVTAVTAVTALANSSGATGAA